MAAGDWAPPPPPLLPQGGGPDSISGAASMAWKLNLQHGHRELVQCSAFNTFGDRMVTGCSDGKMKVFNRGRDGGWKECASWTAHGLEVVELQWLPATVSPPMIASLGFEGRFKLWIEDPSAPPGRHFHHDGRPAYDTRSATRWPYRSFSLRFSDDSRTVHLALLATDGRLTVLEAEGAETITDASTVDEFSVLEQRPARGEETSFRVRWDPNPDPCYRALRAGVPENSLGLVAAAMDRARVYRSRDVEVEAGLGVAQTQRKFFCVAELGGHRTFVRDVAWRWGNVRGYDTIATACSDGAVRVFQLETPVDEAGDGKTWSAASLLPHHREQDVKGGGGADGTDSTGDTGGTGGTAGTGASTDDSGPPLQSSTAAAKGKSRLPPTSTPTLEKQPQLGTGSHTQTHMHTHTHAHLPPPPPPPSGLSATFARSSGPTITAAASGDERRGVFVDPDSAAHVATLRSTLRDHGRPVWRVGFDDDGHNLGSCGDDGRLILWRQKPNGDWARSSTIGIKKMSMATP